MLAACSGSHARNDWQRGYRQEGSRPVRPALTRPRRRSSRMTSARIWAGTRSGIRRAARAGSPRRRPRDGEVSPYPAQWGGLPTSAGPAARL